MESHGRLVPISAIRMVSSGRYRVAYEPDDETWVCHDMEAMHGADRVKELPDVLRNIVSLLMLIDEGGTIPGIGYRYASHVFYIDKKAIADG